MFIIKDNSSSERYCFWFIWFPFSHFGDRNVFEWSRRITQLKFFILFSSRRHGGRTRRLCGIDLTDARSVCKTAHVGTMRPTPRSKWLRRCAFLACAVVQPSTLRSQAALGSGFSLQAAFWYQNAMLALFLRSKKSQKCSPILIPFGRAF